MSDKEEIQEFLKSNPIPEEFSYDAEFKYRLVKDGKLLGIIAYTLQKDPQGVELPRFIHVILDKSIRRTRRGVAFVFNTFKDIQAKGYNSICAVIPKDRTNMQTFARKFRFTNYANDEEFTYWVLNFNSGRNNVQ